MFDDFITDCPGKTPKMKLSIKDHDGNQIGETCETPKGFQLERFVQSQFPTHALQISFINHGFCVKVLDESAYPIRVYLGIYQSGI